MRHLKIIIEAQSFLLLFLQYGFDFERNAVRNVALSLIGKKRGLFILKRLTYQLEMEVHKKIALPIKRKRGKEVRRNCPNCSDFLIKML